MIRRRDSRNPNELSPSRQISLTIKAYRQDLAVFKRFRLIVTVKEHGAAAERLSDLPGGRPRLFRVRTPDKFPHQAGTKSMSGPLFGPPPQSIEAKTLATLKAPARQVRPQ